MTPEARKTPRACPRVHEAFNSLVLKVAGMTGGNVYLRPSDRSWSGWCRVRAA